MGVDYSGCGLSGCGLQWVWTEWVWTTVGVDYSGGVQYCVQRPEESISYSFAHVNVCKSCDVGFSISYFTTLPVGGIGSRYGQISITDKTGAHPS